jgi:uncharacterized SAM-binding protein YcdF (DUF218 family)
VGALPPSPPPSELLRPTTFNSANRTPILPSAEHFALGLLAGLLIEQLGFLSLIGVSNAPLAATLCALAGVAIGLVGGVAWLATLDLGLFAVYLVVTQTGVMSNLAAHWVRNDSVSTPIDAVVVLSGGLTADSSLGTSGTERLLTGLELVRAGLAPRLVTTRATDRYGGRVVSTDAGQRRLVRLTGIDSSRWSVVDSVHSTRDEAMQVARLLHPASARTVAVVTSAIHTKRACATFEGVGFRVRCVAARGIQNTTRRPMSADDRLEAFREYLYERIGMAKYRWKGWISK